MDVLAVIITSVVLFFVFIEAVPPQVCFANFRWDDCGLPPIAVMYYWQPGSRCEVGIWRGCLPNVNMFKSEYECVSTCIFAVTPGAEKYHEMEKGEDEDYDIDGSETTTTDEETTIVDGDETSGSGEGSGDAGIGHAADGSGDASGDAEGSAEHT